MSPIEAMAKAAYESIFVETWNDPNKPFEWDDEAINNWMQGMRAALLALTEADVAVHAAGLSGPVAMRVYQDDRIECFRAILRSIAEHVPA